MLHQILEFFQNPKGILYTNTFRLNASNASVQMKPKHSIQFANANVSCK